MKQMKTFLYFLLWCHCFFLFYPVHLTEIAASLCRCKTGLSVWGKWSLCIMLGTNFWYGPILASDTEFGDMARLVAELDAMKSLGIENLRVLVGIDGPSRIDVKVQPSLQPSPGVYDDELLVGLDRFMAELGKRNIHHVLC